MGLENLLPHIHRVEYGDRRILDMRKWCADSLGKITDGRIWTIMYTSAGDVTFMFAEEKDAVMFKLRWGR